MHHTSGKVKSVQHRKPSNWQMIGYRYFCQRRRTKN